MLYLPKSCPSKNREKCSDEIFGSLICQSLSKVEYQSQKKESKKLLILLKLS